VDEPPTWKPTLIPPTEYIAGVDHLPYELLATAAKAKDRGTAAPDAETELLYVSRMSTQLALTMRSARCCCC